jgi:hypothetical protein
MKDAVTSLMAVDAQTRGGVSGVSRHHVIIA